MTPLEKAGKKKKSKKSKKKAKANADSRGNLQFGKSDRTGAGAGGGGGERKAGAAGTPYVQPDDGRFKVRPRLNLAPRKAKLADGEDAETAVAGAFAFLNRRPLLTGFARL